MELLGAVVLHHQPLPDRWESPPPRGDVPSGVLIPSRATFPAPGGELSSGAVLAATPGCPWQQRGFGAGTGRAQPWVLLGRGLRVPGLELFLLWLSCPKNPRPRYGDPVCVGARFWGVAGGPEVLVSSHGVTGAVLLGLSVPRWGNRAAFNRC